MTAHLEWIVCAVNFALRLTLIAWEVPRAQLQIAEELQRETLEIFSAHSVRQVFVTWPLLALVGFFSTAGKLNVSLSPAGTLVLLVLAVSVTFGLTRIPTVRFRPRGVPYLAVLITTGLDLFMTFVGFAAMSTLIGTSTAARCRPQIRVPNYLHISNTFASTRPCRVVSQ